MYRLYSLVLAVLLTGSMLWGQCASCPLILRAPAHHSCCGGKQHGNCNLPSPEKQGEKQCTTQALAPDVYNKAQVSPALAIAILPAAVAAPDVAPAPSAFEKLLETLPAYSPPDLYLLNSSILA